MFLDLIPVSAQRENIRNLFPHMWEEIRTHAYNKTQYTCTYCKRQGHTHPVEAHEEWVFSGNKIILVDVIPLCPSCHKIKHINFINHPIQFRKAVKYYQHLNNRMHITMSLDDAYRYIYEAMDMLKRHDQHEYIIDTASIERYYKEVTHGRI
jgi:hypothetical protein